MNVQERFLKYVGVPTMSDENSETVPSSSKQLVLAELLKEELLQMGLSDARVDKYGYVYATLPANTDKAVNSIGLIAHMDTSPDAPDAPIKTAVVDYKGGDILLNEKENIMLTIPGTASDCDRRYHAFRL